MAGEEHSSSPSSGSRHLWQREVTPKALAILFAVGIIQYWGFGLSLVYVEGTTPGLHFETAWACRLLTFYSYFAHWSSAGGLIGLFVSKGRSRGGLWGAAIGLILSAISMQ